MKKSIGLAVLAGAMGLAALTGCGPSSSGGSYQSGTLSSPGSPSAGGSVAVGITIKDFGYQGPPSVGPGTTVTVTNLDSQAHTVTADDGSSFDAAVNGSGGTAIFKVPAKPGTYTYHCTYHVNMRGTLVVK